MALRAILFEYSLTHSLSVSQYMLVRCSRAVVNANLTLDARISISNHSLCEQRPKLSAAVCSNKALEAQNHIASAERDEALSLGRLYAN